MKKVFLEDLPRYETGRYKGKVNWKECIGKMVNFIYDDVSGVVEIKNYVTDKQKLLLKYNDNEFIFNTGNFSKCKFATILKVRTNDFKIEIGTHFNDDKRDFIIVDREIRFKKRNNYTENQKWYKYKCNKCGFIGDMIESNIFNKNGCSCCCSTPKIVVEGINDIPTTEPWMIKYFQGGYDEAKLYTKSSSKKIQPICPDCGRIKAKSMSINHIYNNETINCQFCSDGVSYPNKFIRYLMEELKNKYYNLEFVFEYNKEWTKKKRFDCWFKLDDREYFVEMDGRIGHGNTTFSKQNKTIEDTKQDDIYKDELALKNNVEVIRINCNYISGSNNRFIHVKNNIINSKLSNIFNLKDIDWNLINEKSQKNIIKEVCNYWNGKEDWETTSTLSYIFKISNVTIRNYLKNGVKLNWCNYDSRKELLKNNSRNAIKNNSNRDYKATRV